MNDEEKIVTCMTLLSPHNAGGAERPAPAAALQVEGGNGGVIPPRVTSPGWRGCSSTQPGVLAAEIS
jgi:hypothetical protein